MTRSLRCFSLGLALLSGGSVLGSPPVPRPVDSPRATRCSGRVEVPLHRMRGLPVVDVSVNGSRPYRFIVDWGANVLAVSPRLARELRFARRSGSARPGGGRAAASRGGSFRGNDRPGRSLLRARRGGRRSGAQCLRSLLVSIDYPAGVFRLEEGPCPPRTDGRSSTIAKTGRNSSR